MCEQTLVAGRQLWKEEQHRIMYSIMLEHVALFPGPSENNRTVDEAIDHSPHNTYND